MKLIKTHPVSNGILFVTQKCLSILFVDIYNQNWRSKDKYSIFGRLRNQWEFKTKKTESNNTAWVNVFRFLYKDSFSKKNATISNFFLNKEYVYVEKRFGTPAAFYLIFVIFLQ